jgi:hypothetical protein
MSVLHRARGDVTMFTKEPYAKELALQTAESTSVPMSSSSSSMSKEERYELIALVARSLEHSRKQNNYDLVDDIDREAMDQEINFEDYIRTLN